MPFWHVYAKFNLFVERNVNKYYTTTMRPLIIGVALDVVDVIRKNLVVSAVVISIGYVEIQRAVGN